LKNHYKRTLSLIDEKRDQSEDHGKIKKISSFNGTDCMIHYLKRERVKA
jgi:hypothetical protein